MEYIYIYSENIVLRSLEMKSGKNTENKVSRGD